MPPIITQIVAIVLSTSVILGGVFISCEQFNESHLQSRYYFFIAGSILGTIVLLIRFKLLHYEKIEVLSGAFCLLLGYVGIRGLFASSTHMPILIPAALLIYFLLRFIGIRDIINVIIVYSAIVESVWGLTQFAGVISTRPEYYVTGSFDNPAGIASFLSLGFPFCLHTARGRDVNKYVGIIGAIMTSSTILLSQSRAGILSIAVVACVLLIRRYKQQIRSHKKLILPFCIIVIGLIIGLFFVKKDSASGRVLIWEVTAQMIMDAPIVGKGADSFEREYMEYQSEYFKNYPDSRFEYLAGNTKYAFNDYLQIFAEYGVVAIILLVLLIYTIIKAAKFRLSPYALSLIALLVFACFSYPLRYPSVWLLSLYALAAISTRSASIRLRAMAVRDYAIRMVLFTYIVMSTYWLAKDYLFERRWGKLYQMSVSGLSEVALPEYEKLHERWNGNPHFLYNYAVELNLVERYSESITIAKECEQYLDNIDVQLLLADNYYNTKSWDNAEKSYALASLMVPNRFVPLQGLLRVFIETKRFDAATNIAERIVGKKVKVPSLAVSLIKYEAEQFLATELTGKQ